MTDSGATNSKNNDDKVVITAIILGIGGGIGLLFLCIPPATSAFLFSLGGSAMLYRFLGGTSGNTLEIKGLKATASAAILIAGTFGLNSLLEHQLKDPNFTPRTCTSFDPSASSWIPIRKDNGKPTSIKYSGNPLVEELDTASYSKLFSEKNLLLSKGGEVSNENFVLGRLSKDKLNDSIFADIRFYDTSRSSRIKDGDLSQIRSFPFKIKITCLKECTESHKVEYQLLKINDEVIGEDNRHISSNPLDEFQAFQLKDIWYFISVSDYCSGSSSCPSPFARFLVGKIESCPRFRNLKSERC